MSNVTRTTMNRLRVFLACLVASTLSFPLAGPAAVVINEIFYHAPNDIEGLEYVEIHNAGDQPVDLTGWKLTKGIRFSFPAGTRIPAQGYLVVCRNLKKFHEFFSAEAVGEFQQSLSNSGERIDLEDARGKKADSVHYGSRPPWSMGADGYSPSLERISPSADSKMPENWAAAPLSADGLVPSGTPGSKNANYSANLPPVITDLVMNPTNPPPDKPVEIGVQVQDPDGVEMVQVRYRVAGPGSEGVETTIPMTLREGKRYAASIPGQKAQQLVRIRIEAVDRTGARRIWPAASEPRPAISYFVAGDWEIGKIPQAWIINIGTNEFAAAERSLKAASKRGGFGEQDEKRFMARRRIESTFDLVGAWFQLAVPQGISFKQADALRKHLLSRLSERDKLTDEVLESATMDEQLKALPELLKPLQQRWTENLQSQLSEEQMKAFTSWKDQTEAAASKEGRRWGPERVLKQFIRLEAGLFEISVRSSLTEEQWSKVRDTYQVALRERTALVEPVRSAMQGEQEEDREKLEKKFDALNASVTTGLKAALTSSQVTRFEQWLSEDNGFRPGGRSRTQASSSPQGRSALIMVDPVTRGVEVFDFISVNDRSAGYKVHLHKDHPFRGMASLNLIFEMNDRFVLAEPLAYEVYRRAGMAAEMTDFVRLTVDGKRVGYQLLMEQPNRAFLQRNQLKGDGNLYKLLWYGRGIAGQHEKKTRPGSNHEDLITLIDQLEKTKGDEQWEVIQRNFNVPQVATYFAVNMLLSHWDGFFNNYFTYHDIGGKWEMYPWDQDKTWGYYDGLPEDQVFFDMPLTFGMEGDRPPGYSKDQPAPRGFNGDTPWWRPGGYFSKPLLANPKFRKIFLTKTRDLLQNVYKEEVFFPVIDDLGQRLREEVKLRATASQENPDRAVERFDRNLKSLKEHLVRRRQFLLAQEELKTL